MSETVEEFLGDIPEEVRRRAASYSFGQPLLLNAIASSAAARDLFESSPHLLWLVVVSVFEAQLDGERLDSYCRMKQTRLLSKLARNARRAELKLLRKIQLVSGSIDEARIMLDALRLPRIANATAHLSTVDVGVLDLLVRNPSLATKRIAPLLAARVAEDERFGRAAARELAGAIVDIARTGRRLGIDRPKLAVARCRSIAEIHALHDRWVDRMNERLQALRPRFCLHNAVPAADEPGRQRTAGGDESSFPDPPLPDTDEIRAIRTLDELLEEGRVQKHCVASYANAVLRGDSYIYKMLEPERATIELRRQGRKLQLGEFKCARNRYPGRAAHGIVREWLAQGGQRW